MGPKAGGYLEPLAGLDRQFTDVAPGAFTVLIDHFKAGDGTTGTITAPQQNGVPVTGFANTTRKVKFYYEPLNPTTGGSGTMKLDAWEGASNTTASVGSCTQAATQIRTRLAAAGYPESDLHLLVPPDLPFGGVGPSGMGAYHGKAGFDVFTQSIEVRRAGSSAAVASEIPVSQIVRHNEDDVGALHGIVG